MQKQYNEKNNININRLYINGKLFEVGPQYSGPKEEDQQIQEKMEAKNDFENLLFQTKSTIENEKIKEKLSEDEIKIINDKVNENQQWLVQEDLEVEDYSKKKNEFNVFVQPYMTKLYPNQGMEQGMGPGMEQGMGPGMEQGMGPGMDTNEPSIDEVD